MAANRKRHIRQSETAEILRSQINMNPFNPKRHSEEKVLEQKRNFMRVGFMGGINMISSTSVLTRLTMPESILCSSFEEVRVKSTASARSSIEISTLCVARRLRRPPVRMSTYAAG